MTTGLVAPARFDVESVRRHFPALQRRIGGRPVAFLDGPAGTQVPTECIEAITAYLSQSNANLHGAFLTSHESDALVTEAHQAAADFLGAGSGEEIVFGPNMTTLTYAVGRAIGRTLGPGDEVVVTRLDHDANVAPWLALAEERGATVRWVGIDPTDCTLDMAELEASLSARTRLVAVSLASNAVGTIPPVRAIARMVHAAGGLLWVDAVHAAPHMPIDVKALGADFLVCSAYKWFGPHLGMLWARPDLLRSLPALKVRPAPNELPGRWETGTQAHELLAGLLGTFRYLGWLGSQSGAQIDEDPPDDAAGRPTRLRAAMSASRSYERGLLARLLDGLASVGAQVRGITDAARLEERCPTVGFTLAGHHPRHIAAFLGERAINVWDGDYYAYELIRALGLAESGGMVRVGLVHYSTGQEIDRLIDALAELSAQGGQRRGLAGQSTVEPRIERVGSVIDGPVGRIGGDRGTHPDDGVG
ncbi:MAG: cysteine desulfurase-like protein [Candidatus Limnocylindrales bacterium]